MMAVAVFANVTTTRRRGTLRVCLNRHGVRPVIADDFGGDFCAPSFRRKEGIHIAFGFLTGHPGPAAFDSGLEESEIRISHTDAPLLEYTYPSLSDVERRTASI